MNNLTIPQRKWWARLDEIVRTQKVTDQDGLQTVMRQLALEVIADQPNPDKIMLGDQTLRVFGKNQEFKTKAEFINYHRQNGRWGEDSLLFPLANALGYTTFVHQFPLTDLKPYKPYEQPNATGLKIDIVNYTLESENYVDYLEGYHYELKGKANPGRGNCMYYAMAQQVEQDMLFVSQELSLIGLASYQINAPTTLLMRLQNRINNQNTPYLTEKEQAYFDERAKVEAAKEKEVKALLTHYSTDQLIAIYNKALKKLVGDDSYLKNRPEHAAKEHNGNNFMQQAVATGQWDKNFEVSLRDELIHALAKEAWRNPLAYEAFTKNDSFLKSAQTLNQFGILSYNKRTSCAIIEDRTVLSTTPTCVV